MRGGRMEEGSRGEQERENTVCKCTMSIGSLIIV